MKPAGPVEAWQLLAGLIGVLLCLAVAVVATSILGAVLHRSGGEVTRRAERALRWPFRIAVAALLFKLLIPFLGWPEEVRHYTAPIHAVIIGVFGVWAAWYLIEALTHSMTARARRTASAVDDITLSLCLGAVRLTVFFVAVSYVATELSIPTNGILAGLWLSGLAVAFASKETLSNVFGAGILIADRPFKKGDLIKAGEIEGTVEEVGIRSTRIRTAEDTQTIVPNGKLSDASINNCGHRRFGLFKTKIRIAYGATMSETDAFLAKLRVLFADDEAVAGDRTVVAVADLGDTAIGIEVTAYLRLGNGSDESAIKSRLMLGVLRLAEREKIVIGGKSTPTAVAPAPTN